MSVINHGPENPKGIMKKCGVIGISQLIRKMYIKAESNGSKNISGVCWR